MSDKITKSPQIRFAGFTDAWEQRKAEEIFKTVSDKGHPELPVLSASQQLGMVRRDENGIDIQYDKKSVVNYKRVLPKQFVIHLRSFQGGFAHSSLEGITSPAYTIIDFKSGNIQFDLFWKEIFTSKKFIKKLETVTYGIRDGRSISFNDFKTLLFNLPSYKEQEQIAGFFNDLNNLITLHQRELELLKETKKSLLQKMFPKNGDNVPEIRFAEFTDAWEQRKVSYFAEETYGGGTPKTSIEEYWGGNLSWIQSSDLIEHQVSDISTKKKITETGLNNSATKLVPANSIAVVTRVGVGKLAFMPFEYATSQDFLSLSKLKVDEWFGVYSLYKKLQSELHAVQGTSIKGITKEELLSKNIMVPVDRDEQFKIGSFFKNLDNLITLHQRELNSLKNLKKSLLQQMFV
ncbi:MAG: restriction endonuclease subunit S [Bacillota bacterium]